MLPTHLLDTLLIIRLCLGKFLTIEEALQILLKPHMVYFLVYGFKPADTHYKMTVSKIQS